MAAAGCSTADQQQQLQFQQCTKIDAVLIISWSATFLQEVFELPVRPTDAQVCEVGCPPPPGWVRGGRGGGFNRIRILGAYAWEGRGLESCFGRGMIH
jgi:hypothetical protein